MTGDKPSHNIDERIGESGSAGRLEIDTPVVADGPELYRITRDSAVLDVNSSYAYLLWCRDFAQTSAVARIDGAVVGFVTGYIRPDAPDTLVVWQIAVDASQRGGGVASRLLGHLVDRVQPRGIRYLETTITPDNAASIKLFTALARSRSAELQRSELFTADLFPDAHLGEDLYRIGPFAAAPAVAAANGR
ncbi:diaminobutyrate-2-oxoglutarate transaminase/L-2,4-diaminobutyric acid acetyltransferase [Saccharopolyspora antimicrobica]|uniref:L-2,4-diaminobutyric acid acetyltransferase n=1 Tax=Saccharopolyspora antimicrobica TaxID=455193 RepID=A0A1I5G9I6_9PSEU|nr:diaminobutyrate acetyltransferase [Saccharopolyspora antimicrobica]RKT83856.1 diaminobutyrate acetyltransferase [Saccharopolyspora antimicrobica]SFO32738.1 diaminobutyrate-2-oxoglutarate transaminase/L-2,4-diaminobutyric acid acetyltransferase [Saccharopolyspora antimicrobica]